MPNYTTAPSRIIYEEEVAKLFHAAKDPNDSLFICLLWVTGARPAEILELTGADVGLDEQELRLRLPNKKQRGSASFTINERTVTLKRGSYWVEQAIRLIGTPGGEELLFKKTHRRYGQVINTLSLANLGEVLSPYHFRHSSTTLMMKSGITVPELMHLQGRASMDSLRSYTHAVESVIDLTKQNRSKQV